MVPLLSLAIVLSCCLLTAFQPAGLRRTRSSSAVAREEAPDRQELHSSGRVRHRFAPSPAGNRSCRGHKVWRSDIRQGID